MKESHNDVLLVDYLSKNFTAAETLEESAMLTTEDIDTELRAAELAYISFHEINNLLSEGMNWRYKNIPGSVEKLWLVKRCPNA